MARNPNPQTSGNNETEIHKDRPAASLLRSWGKRMSQGQANAIPVYIGGNWSLAVPRGNKRILQLAIDDPTAPKN